MERTRFEVSEFPEALRKHVDPRAPVPLRLMAARGVVPMAPPDMARVLYQLSLDTERAVSTSARETLANTPLDVIAPALDAPLDPRVLDWLADTLSDEEEALQRIILNRATADDTLVRLAQRGSSEICDLLAQNQARALRHPALIEAIYLNPAARMSTVDKLVDLARRNKVTLSGLPALQPLLESDEPIVATGPVMAGELVEFEDDRFQEFLMEGLANDRPVEVPLGGDDVEIETPVDESTKSRNLYLSKLTVAQKIRVGMLGSASDRAYLIRDSNRMVHNAVASSPKSNEHDAMAWSANRALSGDVISYIANRRDWLKLYQVKVNLVNNPKLNVAIALRLMPFLQPKDLKSLVNNRNVSHVVTRQAKELLSTRLSGGAKKRR
jgi:hypothetical protein